MPSFLERLGFVQRLLDGLVVEATAQVIERDGAPRDERLTMQSGCRDASELLRRMLRVDGPTARRPRELVVSAHPFASSSPKHF
ncbi:hypothetical protein FM104_03450 [Microbacterium esteraromaticum]|uniref:Uncharacterized protein n=1 Tax=Microbacterium esteraromaticum TaxID=57043 RepID=A0A1R4IR13_9MICO|nr:hypothetical protein [Microbacterium esteraromaticum]SJN22312.1 hypothetical protein FM104_03450 [Microbacterium esteraromaticum]